MKSSPHREPNHHEDTLPTPEEITRLFHRCKALVKAGAPDEEIALAYHALDARLRILEAARGYI